MRIEGFEEGMRLGSEVERLVRLWYQAGYERTISNSSPNKYSRRGRFWSADWTRSSTSIP